jgi:hypothetical protein
MVVTIDTLAQRYGLLPSEVLSRATTFDLVIMDASMSYQNYQQSKQDPGFVPDVPLEELIKIKEGL